MYLRLILKVLMGLTAWETFGFVKQYRRKRMLVNKVSRENPPDAKILNAGAGQNRFWDVTMAGTTRCDISPTPELGVEYCDVRELPYPDKSFDAVILSHVLEHLDPEDVGKALTEARRVVKDPSKVYVELPDPMFLQTWLNPSHKSIILFNNVYKNPFNLSPKHMANFVVGGVTIRSLARWISKMP